MQRQMLDLAFTPSRRERLCDSRSGRRARENVAKRLDANRARRYDNRLGGVAPSRNLASRSDAKHLLSR
jgi:hypothetical protein